MSERQASDFRVGTYTRDAVGIASALNTARIAIILEHTIIRYGEYTKSGNPKTYLIDIMVVDPLFRPVAIEVEGEGSSSKDNDKRDAYLSKLGITVLHVDNKTPAAEVLKRLEEFRS